MITFITTIIIAVITQIKIQSTQTKTTEAIK